jgi:D-glycero-alpha-D-manno-heptose 1-phosphate guanylyltransferase
MEAILLAGGLGTRLAGRLNGVPKPMAPIAGRPFLEILLGQLHLASCSRVLLSVGHLHSVIESYFGSEFHGMQLKYVIEQEPLGTGGAIRAALSHAAEESVLVLNGDTFLQVTYAELLRAHAKTHASLTIAVARQENIARYGGVVLAESRVIGFEEKGRSGPGWINAGVYALQRDFPWPKNLAEKFSFETDLLTAHVQQIAPIDIFWTSVCQKT